MKLLQLARNTSGVTGIEFSLIAGGIAIATILIMTGLGSTLVSTLVEGG
jgi:Flp pilus assembly pilin Flp